MGVSTAAAGQEQSQPGKITPAIWPWLLLVRPAACWQLLRTTPLLWPALLWQGCAVVISRAISVHAMNELDVAAHLPGLPTGSMWPWFFVSLVLTLVLVVVANVGLAAVIKLAALFAGSSIGWRYACMLALYALLPYALGDALGRISFAVILPLSTTFAGAWAAHLRPFSLGLAIAVPTGFTPLSLPWFFASFFDVFGVWSLVAIWYGLREFAGTKRMRSLWIMLGIVLLLALVLAAAWQVSQLALLRAAH